MKSKPSPVPLWMHTRFGSVLAAALAVLIPAQVLAQEASAPPFALQNPGKGSGPVVLAEIRLERGYPNGESWCPADTNWETDICLGADLVIHKGRVVRKLGADAGADPVYERDRFKQIGGHAVRYVGGGRRVAFIEQTDKDYWFMQWSAPVEKGRFCLPADAIEHFGVESDLAFTAGENGARCYFLRDAKRR